ncbi:MAG TPA: VWA domain-containing protein [Bryobacteraceae bacterium]|jgi:VWFA-related protein|nr:VWA domain-containing protein [Bryobacteraceae bacterium]
MRNTLTMLLLCAAGFAQQPGTLDPAKDPARLEKVEKDKAEQDVTFHIRTDILIAPTTVLDKHGDYVNGLQLQDFQLYDNNKVQKITSDVHDQPLSLVIAVQKSANLNEILPKIQRIGSMLKDLIAGEDGETAIIAFDHRVVVAQDFTNDTGQITQTMKKLTPGSSQHAVDDAVMKGIRMLRDRPKERRRVLLLIAEKRDKGSEIRVREVLTEAEFANVVIYSLDISSIMAGLTSTGMPPPPPSIPAAAQHMPANGDATPTTVDQGYYNGNYIPAFVDIFKSVKSLFVEDAVVVFTRFTGGKEYPFISEKSLERAVQGISQELHSQYLLSYTPNNPSEGGFHEIKVTVNRPQLEIRTRPGYWVASRPDQ